MAISATRIEPANELAVNAARFGRHLRAVGLSPPVVLGLGEDLPARRRIEAGQLPEPSTSSGSRRREGAPDHAAGGTARSEALRRGILVTLPTPTS
jgi:hypothetical protein